MVKYDMQMAETNKALEAERYKSKEVRMIAKTKKDLHELIIGHCKNWLLDHACKSCITKNDASALETCRDTELLVATSMQLLQIMKCSEVVFSEWKHIDFIGKRITIKRADGRFFIAPLNQHLLEILKIWRRINPNTDKIVSYRKGKTFNHKLGIFKARLLFKTALYTAFERFNRNMEMVLLMRGHVRDGEQKNYLLNQFVKQQQLIDKGNNNLQQKLKKSELMMLKQSVAMLDEKMGGRQMKECKHDESMVKKKYTVIVHIDSCYEEEVYAEDEDEAIEMAKSTGGDDQQILDGSQIGEAWVTEINGKRVDCMPLSLATGMRSGEIARLRMRDIKISRRKG